MSAAPAAPAAAAVSERGVGILLTFCAALCWSLGGLGIKLIDADALAISGYRSLLAIPVLLGPVLLAGPRVARALLVATLRRPLCWAGALSYALCVICFVIANKLTTAANAILLQYTAPVYVALLSWPLLRERVRPLDIIVALTCLGGMACFFADRLSASGWTGNAVAIVSGLGFGLLPLMLRREQRRAALAGDTDPELARLLPLSTIVLGNALSALVGAPWMITGAPRSGDGWAALFGLGIVQIGLAYLLFALGVRRLRAVESLLVATVEPILNPVWVALATGELPSRGAMLGGAIILAAVTAHGVLTSLQRPAPPPDAGA